MSGTLQAALGELGLKRVGQMEIRDDEVRATLSEPCDWTGGVYTWVAEDGRGAPEAVKYVGMHNYLLRQRCAEQTGGFHSRNGSGPGRRNAEKIRTLLKDRIAVGIYAKHSVEPLAEEVRLIGKLGAAGGLWNIRGYRGIVEAVPSAPEPSGAEDAQLLPEEAKRRLAATFDVSPDNVEITIRF